MDIKLRESFFVAGTDFDAFNDAVKSMCDATSCVRYPTKSVNLLSFDTEDEDAYYFLEHEGKAVPKRRRILKSRLNDTLTETELIRELTHATKLMLLANDERPCLLFVSPNLISMYAAKVGVFGPAIQAPSALRDEYLSSLKDRVSKGGISIIIRRTGKVNKAFAVHGADYAYIRQTVLLDIIKQMNDVGNCGMGKMCCKNWEMSHSKTEIQIDFPDAAEEMQRMYKLPSTMTPGIKLVTSDVGDASVTCISTFRLKNTVMEYQAYKRRHRGTITPEEIVKAADKELFPEYRKVPEKLLDLMTINVADPTQALNLAVEELGLKKLMGGREPINELKKALAAEINPALSYTAYDIATSLMELPDRIEGLSVTSKHAMEAVLIKAIFLDWERLALVSSPTLGA